MLYEVITLVLGVLGMGKHKGLAKQSAGIGEQIIARPGDDSAPAAAGNVSYNFV